MGVTAAIAEPPQIAVPTPTSRVSLPGTFSQRPSSQALAKATPRVTRVTESECRPVCTTWPRLRPKPSRMTEPCRTCLPAKAMPGAVRGAGGNAWPTAMPSTMPSTAPPSSGSAWPSSSATAASAAVSSRPGMRLAGGGVDTGRVDEAGTADMLARERRDSRSLGLAVNK